MSKERKGKGGKRKREDKGKGKRGKKQEEKNKKEGPMVVASLIIIMNKIICCIYNCVEPLNTGCPTLHPHQKFGSYTQVSTSMFFPSNHLNKFTFNIIIQKKAEYIM